MLDDDEIRRYPHLRKWYIIAAIIALTLTPIYKFLDSAHPYFREVLSYMRNRDIRHTSPTNSSTLESENAKGDSVAQPEPPKPDATVSDHSNIEKFRIPRPERHDSSRGGDAPPSVTTPPFGWESSHEKLSSNRSSSAESALTIEMADTTTLFGEPEKLFSGDLDASLRFLAASDMPKIRITFPRNPRTISSIEYKNPARALPNYSISKFEISIRGTDNSLFILEFKVDTMREKWQRLEFKKIESTEIVIKPIPEYFGREYNLGPFNLK